MRVRAAVPLSGRDVELETLLEVVQLGTSGTPQAVIVQGEAGVGKTVLVRAVVEQARTDGIQVLWGQALRFGAVEAAYHPLVLALEGWLAVAGDAERAAIIEEVPAAALVLPSLGAAPAESGSHLMTVVDALIGRVVVARADRAGGRRRAVGRPVHLGRAGLPRGGVLAATVGPARDSAGRAGGFGRVPAVAGQHPTPAWHPRAGLARLGRQATEQQIAILLGGEPSSRLVEQVYERSRGNPYFTELLVQRTPLGSTELPDVVPDDSAALLESWRTLGRRPRGR